MNLTLIKGDPWSNLPSCLDCYRPVGIWGGWELPTLLVLLALLFAVGLTGGSDEKREHPDQAKRKHHGWIPIVVLVLLTAASAHAQSPWESMATKLANAFTGPIARGLGLVAIVIGGLTMAFSEGGGRRALGGLIFGLGMVFSATAFMTWLFG